MAPIRYYHVMNKEGEWRLYFGNSTEPILADPAELELALINLAINARDAMPGGGRFALRARNVGADALPPLLHGAMVVVEVADSGTGIAPEALPKVFDPFFTTKPVGEGTGLGLSQVYGLCQRSGGTAEVHSRPGQGTTVAMYFPPSPQAAASLPQDGGVHVQHVWVSLRVAARRSPAWRMQSGIVHRPWATSG